MLAVPALAQSNSEMREVCNNVITRVVYPSQPLSNLEIYNSSSGYSPYFSETFQNVQSVTGYKASLQAASSNGSTYAGDGYSRVEVPSSSGYVVAEYSAIGACGFDSAGKLSAIRITSANIISSLNDFQDYGIVPNLGRLIVFRQPARAGISQEEPILTTLIDAQTEKWSITCQNNEVSRVDAEQTMSDNDLSLVVDYACQR